MWTRDPLILAISFVFSVALFGAIWCVTHKRRQAFRAFARSHGLRYDIHDPYGLDQIPFRLFRKGDGRTLLNMLSGPWRGEQMRAFDFDYHEEHTAPNGSTTRTTHAYSCVVLEVDAAFPHLAVDREGFVSRFGSALGSRDIEFESEEFNRRFHVASVDRKFAYELLDARMMQWLLHLPNDVTFEVLDRWLLLSRKGQVEPAGFAPLIEMGLALRGRIPRVAWAMHGRQEAGPAALAT